MQSELKPCPFCGGEARVDAQKHLGRNYVGVICLGCGLWQDTRASDVEGAIAAWNRRSDAGHAAGMAEATAKIVALQDEVADLKQSVIAFGGPWANEYSKMHKWPKGHLHPTHYDILAKCGARMTEFVRHDAIEAGAHLAGDGGE